MSGGVGWPCPKRDGEYLKFQSFKKQNGLWRKGERDRQRGDRNTPPHTIVLSELSREEEEE